MIKLTRSIKLPAKHPGIIFKTCILLAHKLSVTEAAKKMHINRSHLIDFSMGKVSVKAPLAMKLEKATGISAVFWMNLQTTYDLFINSDLDVDCEPLYDLKMA